MKWWDPGIHSESSSGSDGEEVNELPMQEVWLWVDEGCTWEINTWSSLCSAKYKTRIILFLFLTFD